MAEPSPPSTSSPRSPPPSLVHPATTTTTTAMAPSTTITNTDISIPINASSSLSSSSYIHPSLPTPTSQRHISEARTAVVASMSNMVDRELQSRATVLHENAAALARQEADVLRATEGLRREREKLGKEADSAARKLKEVGNVQNWAEVLERQFLVLEETVRLAGGGDSEDEDGGGSSCGSCSCSECGRDDGDVRMAEEEDVDDDLGKQQKQGEDSSGKGKIGDGVLVDGMEMDSGDHTAWSDTSRSLNEPESSTGTGMAKGSETASISTSS